MPKSAANWLRQLVSVPKVVAAAASLPAAAPNRQPRGADYQSGWRGGAERSLVTTSCHPISSRGPNSIVGDSDVASCSTGRRRQMLQRICSTTSVGRLFQIGKAHV